LCKLVRIQIEDSLISESTMGVRACISLAIFHCFLINYHGGSVDAVDVSRSNEDNPSMLNRPKVASNKVNSPFRFFGRIPKIEETNSGKPLAHSQPSSNTLRKIPKISSNERELEKIVNANVKAAATEKHRNSIVKSMQTVLDAKIPKLRKIFKEKGKIEGVLFKEAHPKIPEIEVSGAHQIFKKIPKVAVEKQTKEEDLSFTSNIPAEKESSPSNSRVLSKIDNTVRDIIQDDVAEKHLQSIVNSMKIIINAKENDAINFKKIPIIAETQVSKASSLPSTNSLINSNSRRVLRLENIVRENIKATVADEHLDKMVKSMQTVLGAKIPKSRKVVKVNNSDEITPKKTLGSIVRENLNTAVSDAHLESITKSMKAVLLTKISKGSQRSRDEIFLQKTRANVNNSPSKPLKFNSQFGKMPETEDTIQVAKSIDGRTPLGNKNLPIRQIPGLKTGLPNFDLGLANDVHMSEVKNDHPVSPSKPETTTHGTPTTVSTPSPNPASKHRSLFNIFETKPEESELKLPASLSPPTSIKHVNAGNNRRVEAGVNRVNPHKIGETIRGPFFR